MTITFRGKKYRLSPGLTKFIQGIQTGLGWGFGFGLAMLMLFGFIMAALNY